MPPPLEMRQSAPRSGAGTQSRFCGACGARLGSDEVFCGQCGTPVSASNSNYGTVQGRPFEGSGGFRGDQGETWMPGSRNELTEAFSPAARGAYASGSPNMPYRPVGYDRSSQPQSGAQYGDSARTTRIIAGVACLGVSLVSAVIAILLAR